MDNNNSIIPLAVALIGAVSGLLPIVIAAIFRWAERRSHRTTEEYALGSAQKRLEFLNLWIQTQQISCSDEEFAVLLKDVGDELRTLRKVAQSYPLVDKQTLIPAEDESLKGPRQKRSRWQIAILGYWPIGAVAWIFHSLFYMATGACLLLTGLAFYVLIFADHENVFYEDFLTIPISYALLYLLFWLPARRIAKRQDNQCVHASGSRNSA